jgi:FkbM family methyltransferase
MNAVERWCINLRHSPLLARADRLWDGVRPAYNKVTSFLGRHGLERVINGTDRLLVLPECRGILETYEPEVWRRLMSEVQPGDTVADVGAFMGLYTVALAKRVGKNGRVLAFEPDPANFAVLQTHVELNKLVEQVELWQAAVSDRDGTVAFRSGRGPESRIEAISPETGKRVASVCLDTLCDGRRIDVLKIDVEGFEEAVLKGATQLLANPACCPRAIFIEVHPYNWPVAGTTSESLLALLQTCQYRVVNLQDAPMERIEAYGEIVARKLSAA